MASSMPIPQPPRTPTPPPDDDQHTDLPVGLGLDDGSPSKYGFTRDGLSPLSATFASNVQQPYGSLNSLPGSSHGSPRRSMISPASSNFAYSPYSTSAASESDTPGTGTSESFKNPFNFQPQAYTVGRPPAGKSGGVCPFSSPLLLKLRIPLLLRTSSDIWML
jgi:hypothetical protein